MAIDRRPGEQLPLVHTAQDQFTDLAFGWETAGTGQGYLIPTPNAPNSTVFPFGLNEVDFSVKRGFYTAAQTLSLTASIPTSVIRYTTNGSKPGPANGTIYSGPISLMPDTSATTRGTRRIRAAAFHPAAAVSRVGTNTYLFINGISAPATDGVVGQTNSNNATQTNAIRANATYAPLLGGALTSLSAVSINNPAGNPGTSESETSVEFFHPSGDEPGFQIDCGIQAVGNASLATPKNNFRLYMRSAVPAGYVPPVTSDSPETLVSATTDGSDPRLTGGAINPAALLITPPPAAFVVNGPVLIRMRALRTADGEWSALNEASFFTQDTVPADATNISISEIHYHPSATTPPPGNTEFLEFMNTGAVPADLSGCWFLRGIDFIFPPASVLAPGQRMVVGEAQFLNGTNLANGGERLTLMQPGGAVIRDFPYDDDLPWPTSPDGTGASLVLAASSAGHTTDAWHGDGLHWRASLAAGGNPAASDAVGYAAWKTGHNISTNSDDRDGDGLDGVLEYFTGSDPAALSSDALPAIQWTADGPVLKLRLGPGVEADFTVEQSSDLQTWLPFAPTTLAREPIIGGGEHISLLLPFSPFRSYWRVRVSAPGS